MARQKSFAFTSAALVYGQANRKSIFEKPLSEFDFQMSAPRRCFEEPEYIFYDVNACISPWRGVLHVIPNMRNG